MDNLFSWVGYVLLQLQSYFQNPRSNFDAGFNLSVHFLVFRVSFWCTTGDSLCKFIWVQWSSAPLVFLNMLGPAWSFSPRVGPWGARYLTSLYDVCKQLKVSLLQLKESCMNEEYFLPLVCISPFVLFGTCHCLNGYWWCLRYWLGCNSHVMKIELWG